MKLKVEAVYNWILYPRDFSQVTNPAMYTIGSFIVKKVLEGEFLGSDLTCKGILIPKTQEQTGVLFTLEGDYKMDNQGRYALIVTYCAPAVPTTKRETIAFLSCGILKGVGKKTAEKMYSEFGDSVLEVIDKTPEKLTIVPGISEKKAQLIGESYKTRGADVMGFAEKLRVYHIPDEVALRAYEVLGTDGIELIDRSVYNLVHRRIMSFQQVEAAARTADSYDPRDPVRLEKAVLTCLFQNETGGQFFPHGGNLYCGLNELTKAVLGLLGNLDGDLYSIYNILKVMDQKKMIMWDRMANVIYRYPTYQAEQEAAERVARQIRKPRLTRDDLKTELENECLSRKLVLGEEQKEAVLMALQQPMSVITGFPGTGKTTIQKVILALLERVYKETAVLLAPTGRASKRMMESTNHPASTIHSALQLNESEDLSADKEPRIKTDLLIVDEASMMDIFVFRALMRYTEAKRICIVGDIDQLPSVGCGCVLKDLIETPMMSLTRLQHIYRQSGISGIIENAMHIRNGEFKFKLDETCHLVQTEDSAATPIICKVYEQMVQKYGQEDVILLSPYRRNGELCTNNLNRVLQARLNPDRGQGKYLRKKDGSEVFRVGDPILLMKNMQEKGVVNGDVGKLKSVSSDGDFITVDFDGKDVTFMHDDIQYLDLSYATTVHKSQGSEYKCVILVMSESQSLLLKRAIIYTAVTRAKEKMIIIGQTKAIVKAIGSIDTYQRKSLLTKRTGIEIKIQETREAERHEKAASLMD
ncbi:MAG: AAA family ATPase [Clostridiales bacterium]|nr:AAA family ATPase [Clostridiales bacterium]